MRKLISQTMRVTFNTGTQRSQRINSQDRKGIDNALRPLPAFSLRLCVPAFALPAKLVTSVNLDIEQLNICTLITYFSLPNSTPYGTKRFSAKNCTRNHCTFGSWIIVAASQHTPARQRNL